MKPDYLFYRNCTADLKFSVCVLAGFPICYVKPGIGYSLIAAAALLLIIVEINRKYR